MPRSNLQSSLMSELPKGSVYWRIQEEAGPSPCIENCLPWLQEAGLTWETRTYRATSESTDYKPGAEGGSILRAVPSQRVKGLTPKEVAEVERRYRDRLAERGLDSEQVKSLIEQEYLKPQSKVMPIDADTLDPNYLAFYRYFHVAPHDEWGIYILVDRVLDYADHLLSRFHDTLFAFTPETLMSCVLFEVFQHEFYHHLVECAATVVEMLAASLGGQHRPYFEYLRRAYQQGNADHPHAPLEEALANAYAYNAFTFLTRRKPSYKRLLTTLYREVLKKRWRGDPAGYRSAGHYIGRSYMSGNAQLLAMTLSAAGVDPALLLLVAARVMPAGHSAFTRKADIPTYLLGDEATLRRLGELVPAPNETYVSLYLPMDTEKIDRYVEAIDARARDTRKSRQQERNRQREARSREPRLPTMEHEGS